MRQMLIGLTAMMILSLTLATATAKEEARGDATARVNGEITKIQGKVLTITTKGDAGARETAVTCNDATKIFKEAPAPGAKDAGREGLKEGGKEAGKEGGKSNLIEATFADLSVGQRVQVTYNKSDNVATKVVIARPRPQRGGGEKDRK